VTAATLVACVVRTVLAIPNKARVLAGSRERAHADKPAVGAQVLANLPHRVARPIRRVAGAATRRHRETVAGTQPPQSSQRQNDRVSLRSGRLTTRRPRTSRSDALRSARRLIRRLTGRDDRSSSDRPALPTRVGRYSRTCSTPRLPHTSFRTAPTRTGCRRKQPARLPR
jgi:hypothetical protein